MNTDLFCSNLWRTPGISRQQNPRISLQKVWFPWASKDILNFLAPTPSCGRPPPHPKISGPKTLSLGSFSPESQQLNNRYLKCMRFCVALQLLSTFLFQPQTVTRQKTALSDRTPYQGSTWGRFLVNFWSVSVKMTKTDRKPTENRPKTDQKPTENRLKTDPLKDPDRRRPLRRGGVCG